MGNMSYCRFRNTLKDMQDCLDFLQEADIEVGKVTDTEYDEDISNEEHDAMMELLDVSYKLVELGIKNRLIPEHEI